MLRTGSRYVRAMRVGGHEERAKHQQREQAKLRKDALRHVRGHAPTAGRAIPRRSVQVCVHHVLDVIG